MRNGMHHTEYGKHYFVDIIYRKLQQTVEDLLPNNSSPETQKYTHTRASGVQVYCYHFHVGLCVFLYQISVWCISCI